MPIIEMVNLKKNIVRTKDLVVNGVPLELDKNICNLINCYIYSLGVLYNGTKQINFNPGFTEGLIYWGSSSEELLNNVIIDLKNLDISFRQFGLNDEKKLKKNEYLIKLFYAPPNEFFRYGDFHFMRQDPKTDNWFHKIGQNNQPEVLQYAFNFTSPFLSEEPNIVTSYTPEGFCYELNPVGYFAITEPKFKKRKI